MTERFETEFCDIFIETIEDEFKPNPEIEDGKGLWVQLNGNVITTEFMNWYKKSLSDFQVNLTKNKPKNKKPTTADTLTEGIKSIELIENQMKTQAELLGGFPGKSNPDARIIRDWGMVKQGQKVPVSYEALISIGFKGLNRLFNWCLYEAGAPKKKSDNQSDNI